MHAGRWILILAILAAGCSHGGDREAKSPRPQRHEPKPEASSHAGPQASSKPAPAPVPDTNAAKPKPQRRQRALPWRPDGMSRVVHVRVPRVAVYARPRARHALLVLRKRDERGTQRAFLVRSTSRKWIRVYLPTRPNGSQGWIRARAVRMYTNGYRIVVRLHSRTLYLWRGTKRIGTYRVAVGAPSTPTPRGLFYVVELLKPHNPNGSYGPYAFGLSAHSQRLKRFAGGDGRVGLHGTNQPWLIGRDISHGCIRMRNAAIKRLAKVLPLGTPVYIRG